MEFEKFCNKIMKEAFERIEYAYKKNRKKELNMDIKYWVENNMKFEAKSSINQGKYKFSVNSEVFKGIDNVVFTLLEGNLEENKEIREEFYKMISLEEEYNREVAKVFSQLILTYASNIVINHELGHIMNGHLGYLASRNISKASFLFMNSEKNKIDSIESQVLEMDADAFAAARVIDMVTFDDTLKELNNSYTNLIKDKNYAFLLSIVAATIVFSIQGLGRKRENISLEKVKYLPLRTRLYNYIGCSMSAYKMSENTELIRHNFNSLIPFCIDIENYVNTYIKNIYSFESDEICIGNNLYELSDEYILHRGKLNQLWTNKFRNYLLKYAYFDLAL